MSKAIKGNGLNQDDLKDLYDNIRSNFNNILSKLDSDSGVNDTDYESSNSISAHDVKETGIRYKDSYGFLSEVISDLNSTLSKLDSDSTVSDTNYESNISLDDLDTRDINTNGVNQDQYVYLLNDIIVAVNSLNSKLDSDTGVSDTDYASKYDLTDTVDEDSTSKTTE